MITDQQVRLLMKSIEAQMQLAAVKAGISAPTVRKWRDREQLPSAAGRRITGAHGQIRSQRYRRRRKNCWS